MDRGYAAADTAVATDEGLEVIERYLMQHSIRQSIAHEYELLLNGGTLPTTPYPDIYKRFAEKGVVQDLKAYDPVVILRSLEDSASNTVVAVEGEDQLLKASNSLGVEAFGFRAPCMSVDLRALSFYGEFCKPVERRSLM